LFDLYRAPCIHYGGRALLFGANAPISQLSLPPTNARMQTQLLEQLNLLFHDPIEVCAVILGIISVWLVVKRNVVAFPVGIVMVLLYLDVFYRAKLYSDMLLQAFFAVMQAIGWYQWTHGAKDNDDKITVHQLSLRQILQTTLLILLGTLTLGYLMDQYTDTDVPYADAFTASISVMAQYWLNKQYLQNWTLWIGVDVLYIGLYWYKTLYLTAILYVIFLVLAVMGYRAWQAKSAKAL
jgi:nicotinamide mononucleotide transporter